MLKEDFKAEVRRSAKFIVDNIPNVTLESMKETFRIVTPFLSEEEIQEAFVIIDEVYGAELN